MKIGAQYRHLAPSPQQIKNMLRVSGSDRSAMAGALYMTERTLRKYEDGELDMHPAIWELMMIKAISMGQDSRRGDAAKQPTGAEATNGRD